MSKTLFLEPHYGDIAWSCSGLVAQNREDSIIVSIFPPQRKYFRIQFKGIKYRRKKREEMRFANILGVEIRYLKYKSAFLRGRNLEDLFDKILNPVEKELVIQLREYISDLVIKEDVSEIYCPMAQRNQIDHLIVKKAVAGLKPIDFDIFYYEDFPNFLPESKKLQVSTALKAIKVDISDVIEEKIQGIIQYDSLVEPYFKSKEILVELIRKTPFETFWKEDI
ncbi:MAG: hypothetical protein E3J70_00460 [Candidatus Heimdallarchaeota archaeon]|nr:MAG: hypothetical protein E3J70_00460 [Candidatus Heimdallarchaeota archaeon]